MKKLILTSVACMSILLLFSCADYQDLNSSLHPVAVTLSVTAVTDSTVSLIWTQYDSTDFGNYKVYYSQNDVVESNDSLADSMHYSFDTTKIVSHLTPGTLYYFRVIMNSQYGTFSASNIVSARTTVNGSTVMELFGADSVTDSILVIHWTKCTAGFNHYAVFADTTSSVSALDTMVASPVSDTFARIPMKNFKPNSNYWLKVYAENGTDTVVSSNTIEIQTPATLLKPVPVSVNISKATDSSVTLTWTQYPTADFTSYKIYYAKDDGFTLGLTLFAADSLQNDTVRTVRPLSPEAQYYFRVIVTTQSGQTSTSNAVDTTTLIRRNGVLTWYPPDAVTDSSVSVRWSSCTFNFDHYEILVDTATFGLNANIIVAAPGKDTVVTIKRLAPGQNFVKGHEYWFQVEAIYHDSIVVASSNNPLDVTIASK